VSRGLLNVLGPCGAVLLWCLAPGCSADPRRGYSFTPTHDTSIDTVSVPMFRNNTFTHGLEVHLTDAIVKELQRTTRWRVVGQGSAQAVLSGVITASELRPLSVQRQTGLTQELGVTLTVDFVLRDSRTGAAVVERRDFSATESAVVSEAVAERQETAEDAAVQELARAIVAELRTNW
jgi:hypothetical protein